MPYRTDLAAESAAQIKSRLPGLTQREESFGQISFCTVNITDQAAADATGKPVGEYLTITTPPFHTGLEITEE